MRNVMSSGFQPRRPHKITRNSQQVREKRTALALIVFGVVLACVEVYIVYAAL
ncbi:hypothetical protein RHEC894_CH01698 [Rhizobium sp. CIAT894]|uniref:hypothetical protein n=1 Tax=Rhizobium sp. CIAT894 TaxID=2020312 RepID=UPI000A2044A9|nr:hypothetical protein [Rhizobium sp. CIAT894]ARM88012.1 hypothetical protein RHEC894_CH01698 [Rhizobium sp. CIAT894]